MMSDLRNKFDVDTPRCRGGYLETVPRNIWGDPNWFLEEKEDGVRASIQIGNNESLLVGRNRQDFLKGVEKAKEFRCLNALNPRMVSLRSPELAGTIFDGELSEVFTKSGQYDKGTKRRLQNGDFVGYTTWGVLFWMGDDVRHWDERERWECARKAIAYIDGCRIRLTNRVPATAQNLKMIMSGNLEGAVAKRWNAEIPKGQRTNTYWWKIKGDARRTVDAFIIGVAEGVSGGSGVRGIKPKLDGMAASFTMGMHKNGKIVEIGKMKNLPKVCAEQGLRQFEKFKHKVVEMRVSGWDGRNLRWLKWKKLRLDKNPEDCAFKEQIGGVSN